MNQIKTAAEQICHGYEKKHLLNNSLQEECYKVWGCSKCFSEAVHFSNQQVVETLDQFLK